MFSFSKYTSTPFSFGCRIVVRLSTVLRANRLMDFVRIRSIFSLKASLTIRLNPSRRLVFVPVTPLIGIDRYKLPLRVVLDIPSVKVYLRLIAGKLFLGVRGNTGVSCHPFLLPDSISHGQQANPAFDFAYFSNLFRYFSGFFPRFSVYVPVPLASFPPSSSPGGRDFAKTRLAYAHLGIHRSDDYDRGPGSR